MSYTMAQRIGRFELTETIAQRGASTVFLGRDLESGKAVAVEVIDIAGPRAEELRETITRRASLARQLVHPGIVAIHEVGSDDERVFIAREYAEGRELSHYIAESAPYRPVAVLAWLKQIAAAIDFAHERGIVHGAIDPSSIIITKNGEVKLLGFGVARSLPRTGDLAAAAQPPYYMAPEQIRGEEIDASVDVYAFGAVLYELVTGRPPYESDSIVTSIFRAVNEPLTPPTSFASDLPENVDAALRRALAKSPDERFDTCAALVDAIAADVRPSRDAATVAIAATTGGLQVRYCDQCGAALRPHVKFCYQCGASVEPPPALYDDSEGEIPEVPSVVETIAIGASRETGRHETLADVVEPPIEPHPAAEPPPVDPAIDPTPPRVETGRIDPSRIKVVPALPVEPDASPIEVAEEAPAVVSAPPRTVTPSGKLPPPLSGYARSTGTADLPSTEEAIAEPAPRAKWRGLAIVASILVTLVVLFVLLGMWLAPRFLTPRRVPPPESSALVANGP
jgi:hypothetical protein